MLDLKALRTLRNEEEYQAALKAVRPYFEAEPETGSLEESHFDAIMLLIEHYEEQHFPIEKAKPAEVVRSVMIANHYTQSDLGRLLGSKARASELLNGNRSLSIEQVRKLHHAWMIPVQALIDL